MVDIVHHSLIGVAGAGFAHAFGQDEAAVGFLLGSLLPDLDVFFVALGKSRFMRLHQGVTHSLSGIPAIGILSAAIMSLASEMPFAPLAAGVVAGMCLHVLMDLMNTFGVRLLWPLPGRVCLDAFFFIDIYVLAASTALAIAAWSGAGLEAEVAWAAFVTCYSALRVLRRKNIVEMHGVDTAVPSGILPGTWFVTRREAGRVRYGVATWKAIRWDGDFPETDAALLAALRTGTVFSDLEKALKRFIPVSVVRDGEKTVVISRCVAVPNFGNRFGETRSVIVDGKVVDEVSRI